MRHVRLQSKPSSALNAGATGRTTPAESARAERERQRPVRCGPGRLVSPSLRPAPSARALLSAAARSAVDGAVAYRLGWFSCDWAAGSSGSAVTAVACASAAQLSPRSRSTRSPPGKDSLADRRGEGALSLAHECDRVIGCGRLSTAACSAFTRVSNSAASGQLSAPASRVTSSSPCARTDPGRAAKRHAGESQALKRREDAHLGATQRSRAAAHPPVFS